MRRSRFLVPLVGSLFVGSASLGVTADDPPLARFGTSTAVKSAEAVPFADLEAQAMTVVNLHMTELVPILGQLKATRPNEYRKAIAEIAAEARTLDTMKVKNPARALLELDAWQKRIRVELIAAQLASNPTVERSQQLRSAIEARIDADITRHKFEAELAEAAVVRAREHLARVEANRDRTRDTLSRIETNRSARIEARFQALQPRNVKPTATKQNPRSSQSNAVPMPAPMPTTALDSVPMPTPAPASPVVPMPASESLEKGKSR